MRKFKATFKGVHNSSVGDPTDQQKIIKAHNKTIVRNKIKAQFNRILDLEITEVQTSADGELIGRGDIAMLKDKTQIFRVANVGLDYVQTERGFCFYTRECIKLSKEVANTLFNMEVISP